MLDPGQPVVSRPVQEAVEAYVTQRFGITGPTGEPFFEWHDNDQAVAFLDAAMSWEGPT